MNNHCHLCRNPDTYCHVHEEIENPKADRAVIENKTPMEYLVYSVLSDDAKCHKHGADKYGKLNWRGSNIKATTYIGAIMRHLLAWEAGEDIDPDSDLSHLTHIRACCAVLLDAKNHDTFVDDRHQIQIKSPIKTK